MERFLYRLSTTPHRTRFVLKGALMLHVWGAPLARATKDLDFLGRLENSLETSTLAQWTAFRRKLPNTECPETLAEVVSFLAQFLLPIARACAAGESFEQRWPPGGPWTSGV